ncbi:MAG TPA: cache domain-containing protein, partial [Desulfopila sp.]|nr:cache domain-containing protein [Desulfopila sp.]
MNTPDFFKSVGIRYHLMIWYSLLFMLILVIAGWIIFPLVKNTIEEHIHSKLALTTEALQTAIKTSADISVRNRLRAIAEKNKEILEDLHRQADQGLFSEKEAKKRAAEILLSQTIGQTGYIYAINSEGLLAVHPHAMGSRDVSNHWLARAQRDTKEGYLEYDWKNPGEAEEQPKALYMTYFQPWDWILSVSSYRNEFQTLIRVDDFKKSIESIQLNQGSYAFVLSGSGGILLHPYLKSSTPLPSNDMHSQVFDRIIHNKNGSFTYTVVDQRNGNRHEKLVFFNYIPEFDWIVASTADLETAYAPLKRLQNVFLLTLLLAFFLILPLSLYLGARITHPLAALSAQMRDPNHSATPFRAEERGPGEIGHLTTRFNDYIQRLHQSRRALENEMSERI